MSSAQQQTPAIAPDVRVHGWLWWSMVAVSMLLLGVWLQMGWIAKDRWPVQWVEIDSPQMRVSDDQVRARLQDDITGGFFSLNLTRMTEKIQAMNWVASVNLQRRWPDTVHIVLQEHTPVAYWGTDHLLSDRRIIFPAHEQIQGLPVLLGQEQRRQQVIDTWVQWREQCAQLGLRITRLELLPRGSWNIEFNQDINVALGREQVALRMQRFVSSWPLLDSQLTRPVTIDMRYSNGLAVQQSQPQVPADVAAARLADYSATAAHNTMPTTEY